MSGIGSNKKSHQRLATKSNHMQDRLPSIVTLSKIPRKRAKRAEREKYSRLSLQHARPNTRSKNMECLLNADCTIAAKVLKTPESCKAEKQNDAKASDLCVKVATEKTSNKIKSQANTPDNTKALQAMITKDELKLSEIASFLKKVLNMLSSLEGVLPCSDETVYVATKIIPKVDEADFPKAFKAFRDIIADKMNVYMKSNHEFPIYYCILQEEGEFHILCKNQYAFNCLRDWTKQLPNNYLLANLNLEILTPTILGAFYYEVIYEYIITDVSHFLLQLEKHLPGLKTKHWMLVRQDVCYINERTKLHLIIDGLSSMILTYAYGANVTILLRNTIFKKMYRIPL